MKNRSLPFTAPTCFGRPRSCPCSVYERPAVIHDAKEEIQRFFTTFIDEWFSEKIAKSINID
ncbi:MAG: hypothetical protein IAA97_07740 [Spirochaetes bacterium]|uniref:Uncharacterized protein n=1 Tax=Candidatus Ornithospirochaeta stercoripullorum TaxID=2840899 RepID=A0A9D9H6E0_9SPIO|nr:hypothetical protein [Candidatus Ornithospirochaeta stercoripullorum]